MAQSTSLNLQPLELKALYSPPYPLVRLPTASQSSFSLCKPLTLFVQRILLHCLDLDPHQPLDVVTARQTDRATTRLQFCIKAVKHGAFYFCALHFQIPTPTYTTLSPAALQLCLRKGRFWEYRGALPSPERCLAATCPGLSLQDFIEGCQNIQTVQKLYQEMHAYQKTGEEYLKNFDQIKACTRFYMITEPYIQAQTLLLQLPPALNRLFHYRLLSLSSKIMHLYAYVYRIFDAFQTFAQKSQSSPCTLLKQTEKTIALTRRMLALPEQFGAHNPTAAPKQLHSLQKAHSQITANLTQLASFKVFYPQIWEEYEALSAAFAQAESSLNKRCLPLDASPLLSPTLGFGLDAKLLAAVQQPCWKELCSTAQSWSLGLYNLHDASDSLTPLLLQTAQQFIEKANAERPKRGTAQTFLERKRGKPKRVSVRAIDAQTMRYRIITALEPFLDKTPSGVLVLCIGYVHAYWPAIPLLVEQHNFSYVPLSYHAVSCASQSQPANGGVAATFLKQDMLVNLSTAHKLGHPKFERFYKSLYQPQAANLILGFEQTAFQNQYESSEALTYATELIEILTPQIVQQKPQQVILLQQTSFAAKDLLFISMLSSLANQQIPCSLVNFEVPEYAKVFSTDKYSLPTKET